VSAAVLALRFLLSSLFLMAGVAKLARRGEVERAVRNYELLPARLVRPVARVLGPAEVAGGILLAVGLATPAVAGLLAALLATFTAAVVVNLLRGRDIDCGCFGLVAERRIGWPTVLRNGALAGCAIAVAAVVPAPFSLDRVLVGRGAGIAWDDGVALLVCATLAVFALDVARQTLAIRRLAATYSRSDA
jgi:uncharacterized membrane protein YphA (DoxX/SURF4 family)